MTVESDYLVDRRRLRRRLGVWRALAVIAVISALAVLAYTTAPEGVLTGGKRVDHIARLSISGIITDDRRLLKLISNLKTSERVKGVIISVASPGGTASGGEALYEALRDLNETKPTVTYISAFATSAGYMVALASDHIVARSNAITGSIGVLFQYADASQLLDRVGVQVSAIKSSEMKAEPDLYSAPSEETKAMIAALVDDSYRWFVDLVEERRQFDETQAEAVSNGAIFTGRQALASALIDQVGGEEIAKNWLIETHSLDKDIPVADWRVNADQTTGFGAKIFASLAQALGLNFGPLMDEIKQHTLDGLVSVWHGSPAMQDRNN